MQTIHAVWEKANLGVNAYEIMLSEQDTPEMIAAEEARLREEGAEYIVLKTPVNCPQLLFGLGGLGYTYVETVFRVEIRRSDYHMPEGIARFDRGLSVVHRKEPAEWQPVFDLIRTGIFRSDRVSIDPAFSRELGGNRYANWLKTMLENGGFLYEVLSGEKAIGFFVITRKDENTVDPVLMAMYDEQNDRGMGALLHKKTLDTCFTHECKRLTSTIVSNNAKVLRVYVNAGATIADTLYTYVKHL
ncbi:MAG: hypothetical protein E7319_08485 [Clostridiales bacterium]|nr:hypothetical protein [Clostridiales bacterium]